MSLLLRRWLGPLRQPDRTFSFLLGSALFLLLFAALLIPPIEATDFWWHVGVGEVVLREGRIPQSDLFSYTVPGRPYIYQSWLAGVLLALLQRWGGPALVILCNALLISLAYLLLWFSCREEGCSPFLATAVTLVAFVLGAGNWFVRPQTFSMLLFALFVLLLVRFRRGRPAPVWLLPPLTALWANLHGAFILGIAVQGAALVGEVVKWFWPGRPFPTLPGRSLRALLGTTVASALAMLLNPVGFRLLTYVRTIQSNPVIQQYILEWQPPRMGESVGTIFYLSLLGLFFFLIYRRHRPDPVEALWLAGLTWLAIDGVRSILWYGFSVALVLAQVLAGRPQTRFPSFTRRQVVLSLILIGLLVGLVTLCLPWFKGMLPLPHRLQGILAPDTPVRATDWIEEKGLEGRLFHRMEYGGYLFWRFYPERRVFIDSRIELYPEEVWKEYAQMSAGEADALVLLDTYGVEVLLLNSDFQAGLLDLTRRSGAWRLVYINPEEESAVLVRRRSP